MKNLFFASFMLAVMFSGAQVTINSTNIIGADEPVVSSVDTVPPAFDLLGAGNQSWDFTTLAEDRIDTAMFVDAAGTPYAADFPTANLESDDGSIFYYVIKDNSRVTAVGLEGDFIGSGVNHVLHFLPNGQQLIFSPMTYQDNDSSSYYYDLTIDANEVGAGSYGDSIRSKHIESQFDTVDAYGQVDIPNASFDCIREKSVVYKIDSIWIHNQILNQWMFYQAIQDTTYTYNWYSDDPLARFSVASVDFNPNTNQPLDTTDFSYLKFDPNYVDIPTGKGFGIYPNPAKDNFFAFGLVPGSEVELLDVTGNVILKQIVSSSKEKIDLSSVKTGIYFVKAVSGEKVYLKKLIVQ